MKNPFRLSAVFLPLILTGTLSAAVVDTDWAMLCRHRAKGFLDRSGAAWSERVLYDGKVPFQMKLQEELTGGVSFTFSVDRQEGNTAEGCCMFEILDSQGNVLTFLNTGTRDASLRMPPLETGSFLPEGTREIKAFENPSMRFPEGAKLRSVKVIHHVPQVRLMLPEDGAVIADNTPDFYWQSHSERVTLEYSQDPGFDPAKTVSATVKFSQSVKPEKPLAPGKWYWRVRSSGGVLAGPRTFTQTVPAAQDCDEPLICAEPTFVPEPQDPLIFSFREAGKIKSISGEYCGNALRGRVIAPGTAALDAPDGGWWEGVQNCRIRMTDAAGNTGESLIYLSHRKKPQKITWDDRGMLLGGERYFPLGVYIVRENEMEPLAKLGVNFFQHYGADLNKDENVARKWLDQVQSYRARAMVSFNRDAFKAQDFDFIARKVGHLMDHPSLVAWYLFDEPELPKFSVFPEEIRRINQLVKALDPYRPTLLTFYIESMIPSHRGCCDVYLHQAYQSTDRAVLDELEFVDKMLQNAPDVRRFNILHIAHLAKNPDQMFNAALLALIKGDGGLTHWWVETENKQRRFDKHPDYFRRLRAVIPIFAAPGECRKWMENNAVCWEKTIGNDHYFIAVNANDDAIVLKNGTSLAPHSRMMRKNGKDWK